MERDTKTKILFAVSVIVLITVFVLACMKPQLIGKINNEKDIQKVEQE